MSAAESIPVSSSQPTLKLGETIQNQQGVLGDANEQGRSLGISSNQSAPVENGVRTAIVGQDNTDGQTNTVSTKGSNGVVANADTLVSTLSSNGSNGIVQSSRSFVIAFASPTLNGAQLSLSSLGSDVQDLIGNASSEIGKAVQSSSVPLSALKSAISSKGASLPINSENFDDEMQAVLTSLSVDSGKGVTLTPSIKGALQDTSDFQTQLQGIVANQSLSSDKKAAPAAPSKGSTEDASDFHAQLQTVLTKISKDFSQAIQPSSDSSTASGKSFFNQLNSIVKDITGNVDQSLVNADPKVQATIQSLSQAIETLASPNSTPAEKAKVIVESKAQVSQLESLIGKSGVTVFNAILDEASQINANGQVTTSSDEPTQMTQQELTEALSMMMSLAIALQNFLAQTQATELLANQVISQKTLDIITYMRNQTDENIDKQLRLSKIQRILNIAIRVFTAFVSVALIVVAAIMGLISPPAAAAMIFVVILLNTKLVDMAVQGIDNQALKMVAELAISFGVALITGFLVAPIEMGMTALEDAMTALMDMISTTVGSTVAKTTSEAALSASTEAAITTATEAALTTAGEAGASTAAADTVATGIAEAESAASSSATNQSSIFDTKVATLAGIQTLMSTSAVVDFTNYFYENVIGLDEDKKRTKILEMATQIAISVVLMLASGAVMGSSMGGSSASTLTQEGMISGQNAMMMAGAGFQSVSSGLEVGNGTVSLKIGRLQKEQGSNRAIMESAQRLNNENLAWMKDTQEQDRAAIKSLGSTILSVSQQLALATQAEAEALLRA